MRAIVLALGLLAVPAAASDKIETSITPNDNAEHTVSVGEVIWSAKTASVSTSTEATYVLDERAFGGGLFSTKGTADVPAGSLLVGVPTKDGVKACETNAHDAVIDYVRACFTDEDNDGAFDHFSYKEDAKLGRMRQPARYHRFEKTESAERSNFQVKVTYLGVSSGGLSLSYREFTNDLARPAFTENFSIPLGSQYPQVVRFKGVEMKVLGIDGLGLRYLIISRQSDLAQQIPSGN